MGVRAQYAEAYPNFGEGPKLYLSLKLQWNPDQDVNALLREWAVCCVGQQAAADLLAYYALWEDFWTGPAIRSPWFTREGEYLGFSSPAYLEEVSEEMLVRARALLESAESRTETERQRARARLLLRAFEYYEATARAFLGSRSVQSGPIETEAEALRVLDRAAKASIWAAKREVAVEELAEDPVLQHSLPHFQYPALRTASWGIGNLWVVHDWVGQSTAVRDRLAALSEEASETPFLRSQAKAMLDMQTGTLLEVAANGGFENGSGPAADGWSYWTTRGIGSMERATDMCRKGECALLVEGIRSGGPHQEVPVTPGRYLGLCEVYVPEGQDRSGTVSLVITMRDDKGENLDGAQTLTVPPPGRWTQIATFCTVPAETNGKKVAKVIFLPHLNGFQPGDKVYVDECRLFRMVGEGE